MVVVARQRFEIPVAVVAVRPRIDAVGGQAVSVPTHFTRVLATMFSFVVVSLLARMAPITPVEVAAHGGNDVEMMIVVEQVDTFRFVRSFPNNFIQMFFGHDAKLVVRNHLLKGLYLV